MNNGLGKSDLILHYKKFIWKYWTVFVLLYHDYSIEQWKVSLSQQSLQASVGDGTIMPSWVAQMKGCPGYKTFNAKTGEQTASASGSQFPKMVPKTPHSHPYVDPSHIK